MGKVYRTVGLDVQTWVVLEEYMKINRLTLSEALGRCIRHGVIRLQQLEERGDI